LSLTPWLEAQKDSSAYCTMETNEQNGALDPRRAVYLTIADGGQEAVLIASESGNG